MDQMNEWEKKELEAMDQYKKINQPKVMVEYRQLLFNSIVF